MYKIIYYKHSDPLKAEVIKRETESEAQAVADALMKMKTVKKIIVKGEQ